MSENKTEFEFKKPLSNSTGKIRNKQVSKSRPSPVVNKERRKVGARQSPRCKNDLSNVFEKIGPKKVVLGDPQKENYVKSGFGKPSELSRSNIGLALRDAKNNANRTLSSVRNAFDSITERLRSSTRRSGRAMSDNTYASLNNSFGESPVKLYSPFSIETPSPRRGSKRNEGYDGGYEEYNGRRGKCTPRKFTFSSPTGKLQNEVKEISQGIGDLNIAAKNLRGRISKN